MKLGIKPTVDIVFKKLLGSEEHLGLTTSFLNAVLARTGRAKAESVSILNPFRPGEFRGDKDCVLDIRARDAEGREFQLEVQLRTNAALPRRMLHGWAACYLSQARKGRDYVTHRPVVSIWLLEERLFRDDAWLHAFEAVDREGGRSLFEDLLVVTLELSAWRRSRLGGPAESIDDPLEKWLYFFSEGEELDPEQPSPVLMGGEFEEAIQIMETFTKSEAARHAYEKRLDYRRDRMAQEREDREKALAEGERVKALETARKLTTLGMAVDTIAEVTGLSREEVEGLG